METGRKLYRSVRVLDGRNDGKKILGLFVDGVRNDFFCLKRERDEFCKNERKREMALNILTRQSLASDRQRIGIQM